jgi:uncharacterized membrane protein YccC
MKLAEALMLRADCQKRIAELRGRLIDSAKVQEGETPPENPQPLLEQIEQVAAEMLHLIQRINRTNSATPFSASNTLTDALAERDILYIRRKNFEELAEAATVRQDRYSRSEVKFQSTFDVGMVRKRMDELSKQARQLDMKIQELNWTTELVE